MSPAEFQALAPTEDPAEQRFQIVRELHRRTTWERTTTSPSHQHFLARVALEGSHYQHAVTVGEPVDKSTDLTVAVLFGYGEGIEAGIGEEFHHGLSDHLPGVRTVSIGTAGIGKVSEQLNFWSARHTARLDAMAKQRNMYLEAICGQRPLAMAAISMGTVITHKMVSLELDKPAPGLNVQRLLYYAPAIVPPERVWFDMGLRFPPHVFIDGLEEIFWRSKLHDIPTHLSHVMHSARDIGDMPAMFWQGLDLLHGTPLSDIHRVAARYPMTVMPGTKDPLGELHMWQQLARRFPGVSVKPVAHRGHGMAFDGYDGGAKVAKEIHRSGLVS